MSDGNDAIIVAPPGGGELVRPANEAFVAREMGEERLDPALHAAQARRTERRESFDTVGDKVLTFAEGVIDAVSLGLIHEPGEEGDLRRDVNAGSALLGQLVGTVAGLHGPGPLKVVAEGGEAAGRAAAGAVLGEIAPGGRRAILAGAAGGAGEMSAMMGAAAFGHQVTDAVIGDKEFAGHAILDEVEMGALLGGGVKFLSGVFGRAASRGTVAAQDSLMTADSPAAQQVASSIGDVRSAWDTALDAHERRLGVIRTLADEGKLPNVSPTFMEARQAAMEEARAAAKRLDEVSFSGAVDKDPAQWARWHGAMEDYQESVQRVDALMRPRDLEMLTPRPLGKPLEDPGPAVTHEFGLGDDVGAKANVIMESPELRAEYRRIYGRDFEGFPEEEADDAAPKAGPATADPDAKNLGGKVTETSERKTPMERAKAAGRAEEPPAAPSAAPPADDFKWPAGWGPGTTPAVPLRMAGDRAIYEGGMMGSAADVRQNAAAFAEFMEKSKVTPGEIRPAAPATSSAAAGEAAPMMASGDAAALERPGPLTPVLVRAPHPPTEFGPTPVIPRPAQIPSIEPRARLERTIHEARLEEGKDAVRRYIDGWYETARQAPVASPGDRAAAQIKSVLDDLKAADKGRATAAGSTNLGAFLGLPPARSALGAQLNDMYTLRRLTEVAADASKGTVVKSGSTGNRTLNWLTRRAAGKVGASVAGAAIGHTIGGPLGYFAAAAMATKYAGFAGRAAGMAGRLYQSTVTAVDSLLKGNRGIVLARAAAGNRPYQYSAAGPIEDPVERILEIRRVAASPATMSDTVSHSAGDVTLFHPELVGQVATALMTRMQYLAMVAPPIQYDQLGRPIQPPAGAMRKFFEAERAVNDVQSILASLANGSISHIQADALANAHVAVHAKVAAFLMKDPVVLQNLRREQLKVTEMLLGAPLTPGADPMFVARQQLYWQPAAPTQSSAPAQALKIPGAGGPPSARPTPSQSYSTTGRAPGN